jgi:hypothetical protein
MAFPPIRSALLISVAVACLAPSALAQPIRLAFEAGASSTSGGVSGSACTDDPQHCGPYRSSITAQTESPGQQFSRLTFRFDGDEACGVSAPTAAGDDRAWDECPSGPLLRPHRLEASGQPGADYGLKRLRICSDAQVAGSLAGVEARFFKLPHLGPNAPGQEVVTRSFERDDCREWRSWSRCPAGTAASRITLHTASTTRGIEGIELHCRSVGVYTPRGR